MKVEDIDKIKKNVQRAEEIRAAIKNIDYTLNVAKKWDNVEVSIPFTHTNFLVDKVDFNILSVLLNKARQKLKKELESL